MIGENFDAVWAEWLDEHPEVNRFAVALWDLLAQVFAPVTAVAIAVIEWQERRRRG